MTATVFILCALFSAISAQTSCTDENIEMAGRVVFGEAGGEPFKGQLAVAWTIVNRVNNHDFNYPNTVRGVVNQTYGPNGLNHEYNTLDNALHSAWWYVASFFETEKYQNATIAAAGALCGTMADPTGCATAFCAYDPCSATNDTLYAIAYNKTQIGNHFFVCQKPK